MVEKYTLDTSAILALIEDEAGADRVEQILHSENVIIPWPVLMELYYITEREINRAEADTRYALVKSLPVQIRWGTEETTLLHAAHLKAANRISFADALIAAYARQEQSILLHKDPEYEALATDIALEALPYK